MLFKEKPRWKGSGRGCLSIYMALLMPARMSHQFMG